jgi:hypothetical protein
VAPDHRLNCAAGRPVTCPNTVTGAPKATGAVLKISVKVSASSGGKPTRISKALVIATGVVISWPQGRSTQGNRRAFSMG